MQQPDTIGVANPFALIETLHRRRIAWDRVANVEALLEGKTLDPELHSQAGNLAMHSVNPPADVHADTEYRRDLVRTLTVRALGEALRRARGRA